MLADLIREALLCEALAAKAKERAAQARAALNKQAVAEYRERGYTSTWRVPGLGSVPLAISQAQVKVTDSKAFAEWVAKRHPEQIVTQVREVWQKSFLAKVAELGDPPITDDGEIIPGLDYVPGGVPKGVSIRAEKGVKAAIALMAQDALDAATPALPAGGSDE